MHAGYQTHLTIQVSTVVKGALQNQYAILRLPKEETTSMVVKRPQTTPRHENTLFNTLNK